MSWGCSLSRLHRNVLWGFLHCPGKRPMRCPLLPWSIRPPPSLTLPYHEQAAALFAKHRSDRCLYSHSAIAAACWPRTKAPRHKQRTNVKENSRIAKDHISAVYLAGGGREQGALQSINRTESGVQDISWQHTWSSA